MGLGVLNISVRVANQKTIDSFFEDADMTTMEEAMAKLGIQLGSDGEFRSELEDEVESTSHQRERDAKPPLISEI